MDSHKVQVIIDYLTNQKYPVNASKSERYCIRRRAEKFELLGGDLLYVSIKKDGRIVKSKVISSQEDAKERFKDCHGSVSGAHCGMNKTVDAMSLRYYWPGMQEDIFRWISECADCQKTKVQIKAPVQYMPILVNEPWELVGMDLIGKLTVTANGNQYICTVIDYMTKWTEAFPLKNKSGAEVASCIATLCYRFGVPKRILTDNGKEFVNEMNTALFHLLGIKHSLATPYHPQTNGLVERMNGTIQTALSKVVADRPDTWDLYLDAVLFGLRTKKQMTTKYSPYFLMFGREARYPSEVPENYEVAQADLEKLAAEENVAHCIQRHDQYLKLAMENAKKVASGVKAKKQSGQASLVSLNIGDKVLKRNVRAEQRKGGKLDPALLGPFTVVNISKKLVDIKSGSGNLIRKVSIDHLQKFKEPTEPPARSKASPLTDNSIKSDDQLLETGTEASAPGKPLTTSKASENVEGNSTSITTSKASLLTGNSVSSDAHLLETGTEASAPGKPLTTLKESEVVEGNATLITTSKASLLTGNSVSSDAHLLETGTEASAPGKPLTTLKASENVEGNSTSITASKASLLTENSVSSDAHLLETGTEASPPGKPLTTLKESEVVEGNATSVTDCKVEETMTGCPSLCQSIITDAWSGITGHVLVSKVGTYLIWDTDLQCLKPEQELEGQVINAFLHAQVRRHNDLCSMKAFHIDSYAMTSLWHGKTTLRKLDPSQYHMLLGPVHANHHWTLVVIYPGQKKAVLLNPLGEIESEIEHCKNATRAYLRKANVVISRWDCCTIDHPKQQDSRSCGVFVCKFAEFILKEEQMVFSNSHEAVNGYRREIAEQIINESDSLSDLCRICRQKSSTFDDNQRPEQWIACDVCEFWFHLVCVDEQIRPEDIQASFLCSRCFRNLAHN